MKNLSKLGKVLGILAVTVVVGGVIGMLFAPCKGCETRKKINESTDELTSSLKNKLNQFFEDIKKELFELGSKTGKFMKKEKEMVENLGH